jgi:hypothetical protein
MILGAALSTKGNIALEKTNKIRGEWLHLVNPKVGSVSLSALKLTSATIFGSKMHRCGQLSLTCGQI